MPASYSDLQRAKLVVEALANMPTGGTSEEIWYQVGDYDEFSETLNAQGVPATAYKQISKAIQVARDELAKVARGEASSIFNKEMAGFTIISPETEDRFNRRWIHQLVGPHGVVHPDGKKYLTRGVRDVRRRCKTYESVCMAAAEILDGRTNDAKVAKIYAFRLKQAREEVAMMGLDTDTNNGDNPRRRNRSTPPRYGPTCPTCGEQHNGSCE
jgi:hypothetical protein